MFKWGMVIDLDKCTGCAACQIACCVENNIPPASQKEAAKGRSILWLDMITFREGNYPNQRVRFLPRPCFHCENPPCVKVCPVGATYANEEGFVAQIYARCIGCRYCTNNCPYTAKYFNWTKPEWPEEMRSSLNPDVSIRPKGVVEKCTFCHHRYQKAKERAEIEERGLQPEDYVPACVESCPAEAMYFGDLNDSTSQVSVLAESLRAFRLMEDLGTEPKVIYLSEGEWRA